MINQNFDTAILIFSRTPSVEAVEKPVLGLPESAKATAEILVQKTRQIAADSGLPVFFISEKKQRGDTFGERFSNAVSDVFDKGFANVISIGNDCPSLSVQDLQNVALRLKEVPCVLGPSNDGGVYLIGINKAVFQKNIFENISWQTENVLAELLQLIENQCFTHQLLSYKFDIDSPTDFISVLQYLDFRLKKIFLNLLKNTFQKSFRTLFSFPNPYLLAAKSLRAPPVFAHF